MQWTTSIAVALCCFIFRPSEGANVLLIPVPMRSMFHMSVQAGDALRSGGHEVWIMGGPEKEEALTKKGFHYLTYDISELYKMERKMGDTVSSGFAKKDSESQPGIFEKMKIFAEVHDTICPMTLGNKALVRKIQDQHFDIAVVGTTLIMSCLYLIPYKFGIPYVSYQPADVPWLAGVTSLPSFQPMPLAPSPLSNEMSFSERFINTAAFIGFTFGVDFMQPGDYQTDFAPEMPHKTLSQLRKDSLMWFIIVDNTCLDYPRMSAPNYRIVGGLTPSPSQPLTGHIKTYLDDSKDGFILLTSGSTRAWGQLMELLVPMIREVAPKFKQRFVLQYVSDQPPKDLPANVRYEPWISQNDVLGHKNIRAFVSHGGANGQYEATYHAVPILCLGFMEEQQYNCLRVVEHQLGVWLPINEATTDSFQRALTEIIENPVYQQNMTRCSQIMHDIPHASEVLLFWVNHVLQFGAAHLRPPSADMPFYKLLMFDIMAFVIVVVLILLFLLYSLVKCLCWGFKKTFKAKKD